MDWARAVEINRIALSHIVAEILALVGLAGAARMPRALYVAAERLLQPTEAALRRLIVIAARGLVVKPLAKCAMPVGLVIKSSSSPRMSFRLFDKRQSFDFNPPENPLFKTVQTHNNNPFNLFNSYGQLHSQESAYDVSALNFNRRLAAVVHALKTIPSQARRLARWKARRKKLERPKFTSPLRMGPPPGTRNKPTKEIDFILRECHALAWDAQREDSS
jgi:hypothetical protein